MADKVSDESENKFFVSRACTRDFMVILELVSTHYLLTVYDEYAFNRFCRSFYWSKDFDFLPKLTLDSALILLGNQVLLTAPLMLQAHAVLLAAQCISIEIKSEPHLFESYLSAFELSVGLYDRCMPLSECRDEHIDDNIQLRIPTEDLLFCTCIQQVTMEKLTLQTEKLLDFSCASSLSVLPDSRVDIRDYFAAYIKENQHVVDESCMDEVLFILNAILSKMVSSDDVQKHLHRDDINTQQKLYYVAAVIKLMSSSLLQIIWFLRKSGPIDGAFTSQTVYHRASNHLSFIIGSFGKYKVNQHDHEVLLSAMKNTSITPKAPYLMLSHIVSLLLYSFKRRFEVLQKGCIFLIMTIMNLQCLEDENFNVFESFIWSVNGNSSSTSELVQNGSATIASDIRKTSMLLMGCQSKYLAAEEHWAADAEREEGTSMDTMSGTDSGGGESYFNSFPEHSRNPSEWKDLTDFVQCKPGKDYKLWAKNKRKYRIWLFHKKAHREYQMRRIRRRRFF